MSNNAIAPAFAEHLAAFMERLKVLRYSPATLVSREHSVRKFFHWLQAKPGGVQAQPGVRDVTKQTVRDFQEYLLGRYTTHTTHVHLISLRRFFEHLEKTDVLLVNPCEGVPLPRLEQRLPRSVFTPEEVRRILDAPDVKTKKGIRDKAILETFYSTGIRLEEMARLSVHDVDLTGYVRVNRGKGAKDRVVPLGVKAAACVRDYLERVRVEWARDNAEERALWLAGYWPHHPIQKQIISVMLRQYAKAVGITKQASPHVWRHTCATHLVGNGANIAYAQLLLGHRTLRTTQIYTRVSVPEIKVTHAEAHPRKAEPSASEIETAHAPLQSLPMKMRAPYHYKQP
jgi:integrase/recombinase XerD